jgi:catechol 2,3-dioxygenase-like lactoylglutathione lyase family enzyme
VPQGALPTVFVSDIDRAVAFYTDVLGLALAFRAGDHWASIDAGGATQIGLHPRDGQRSAVGNADAISAGLNVTGPLETVMAAPSARGVEFGDVSTDGMLKIAHFTDPDGNPLYLCEPPARGASGLRGGVAPCPCRTASPRTGTP